MNRSDETRTSMPPDEIVDALNQAVDALLRWNADWHAPFVVGLDEMATRRAIADSLRYLDTFEEWFNAHSEDGLVNQPSMQRLNQTLLAIRERAAKLSVADMHKDGVEYAALMNDVQGFVTQVRRLINAFAVASSELDALTGIQNRLAMRHALANEHARMNRGGDSAVIVLIDLDHLKAVNDEYGHASGDEVLRATAERLASKLRGFDQLFRYGGEEFLVMMPNTDMAHGVVVLNRLREALKATPIHLKEGADVTITASFGAAILNADQPIQATIEAADAALYQAKESGRDKVVSSEMI